MAILMPTNGKGGYDYSFVDAPPKDLVCKICRRPSREPHLSVCCGYTFCKTCLEGAKQADSVDDEIKNACPICRKKNFTTVLNKQNERAIKNLHVFCTNKDKGCDWQGEMSRITDHLANSDGCQFEETNCSNECGLSLQRQCLSKHVDTECPRSQIICQYCNTAIGERQFINGQHHKEQCPKFPLPCPNKCEVGTVLRENIKTHRAECPLEMIHCEYYEMGCEDSMARKDQVKHYKEEMENHLSLMKSEYLHTKDKLAGTEQTVISTKQKLADAEKRIRELERAMEDRIKKVEIQLQKKIQLVENMMFKHAFQWYRTLEGRVKSKCTKIVKIPVTLKMSEYLKNKGSDSDWYSDSFSWELSVFDQYPEMKLQVTPAGRGDGKGTHLSVQLYLVKGGYKRDFIALEQQNVDNYNKLYFWQEKERLGKVIKELKEKQRLWETISPAHLHVKIINQVADSEHHSVQTNQIDLTTNHFLTNEDCNVLIFDSPCFVSNEVLYKSTATCRYLKDDNLYFFIKMS